MFWKGSVFIGITNLKIYHIVTSYTVQKVMVTGVLTGLLVFVSHYSNVDPYSVNDDLGVPLAEYHVRVISQLDSSDEGCLVLPFDSLYYIENDGKVYIGYTDEVKEKQVKLLGTKEVSIETALEEVKEELDGDVNTGIYDAKNGNYLMDKRDLVLYSSCPLIDKVDLDYLKQLDYTTIDYDDLVYMLRIQNTKILVKK